MSRTHFALAVPRDTEVPLANESLYSALRRIFLRNHTMTCDVGGHLSVHILGPLSARCAQEFGSRLGITLDMVGRLCGADFTTSRKDFRVVAPALRFCRACLGCDYHSILFQHLGLVACPLHKTALEDCCPHCGAPIKPTVRSIIEFPYECPGCRNRLARSRREEGDAAIRTSVDGMLSSARIRLTGTGTSGLRRRFDDRWSFSGTRSQASRYVHRATDFGTSNVEPFLKFPEEIHVIGQDHCFSDMSGLLMFLVDHCPGTDDTIHLVERFGSTPRGVRTDMESSLTGALLYKTLVSFNLLKEFCFVHDHIHRGGSRDGLNLGWCRPIRYGEQLPDEPHLDDRLFQLEILGLLACLLARHGQQSPLQDLSWQDVPHPICFVPHWGIDEDTTPKRVRMRPRATEDTLLRLFRRRGLTRLSPDVCRLS